MAEKTATTPSAIPTQSSASPAETNEATPRSTAKTSASGDETILPAVCYDNCNNTYIEVSSVGKTPSICDAESDFSRGYRECIYCIEANADDARTTIDVYIEPKFQQFLEYCASQTSRPSYPSTLMTIRTMTQFADITALNGRVQWGVLQTRIVTELKGDAPRLVTATSRTLSRQTMTSSKTPHASTSATGIQEPSPETSKAWIAGPVIGVLTAILLVLAGLWFLRRHRGQRFGRSAVGGNDNGKEEFIKAQLHSDSIPRHPATDFEGSYPKGMSEMSANEILAQQVLFSDGQHEEGVTGRNS
ncbi:glycoprotein X [Colletotrichum tofieldiae]|uniref:Glycoprotein X n=1 Tax=Colletotrichum tofieldiae TaxID=708197 RepID=A0A166PZK5_9PEZI|nr:glycoprotein X [Colletotrichum tofieldiae]